MEKETAHDNHVMAPKLPLHEVSDRRRDLGAVVQPASGCLISEQVHREERYRCSSRVSRICLRAKLDGFRGMVQVAERLA